MASVCVMTPTQSSILRQIARKCSVSVALCRPVSWMRALAAVSSSLSVAISAAAYAVRSSLVKQLDKRPSINQRPHECLFAPWRHQSLFPRLAKIFGDAGVVLSRHWLIFDNRLAQRPIRSDEFVLIVAVAVFEQFAQRPQREDHLCFVHAHFLRCAEQRAGTCHGMVKRRLTVRGDRQLMSRRS